MEIIAKPIMVIAYFDMKGMVNPIRFKIQDNEEKEYVYKIDRIISQTEEKLAGNPMLVFKCQSVINNINKVLEIKYDKSTCKWMLYKL